MLKRLSLVLAVAATALLSLTAAPASANNSGQAVAGARCVAAGVKYLATYDLLRAAALRQIDYDTIDSDGGTDGPINADLPPGSFLPLGDVIRLHFTNPELFDWCLSS